MAAAKQGKLPSDAVPLKKTSKRAPQQQPNRPAGLLQVLGERSEAQDNALCC